MEDDDVTEFKRPALNILPLSDSFIFASSVGKQICPRQPRAPACIISERHFLLGLLIFKNHAYPMAIQCFWGSKPSSSVTTVVAMSESPVVALMRPS